ncbi:MAG TPA: hypothetical protein VJ826_02185 [Candidatus Polarisedimenticolaceae bacterium]|nr:hypothetical protein [Candidatus Polarisedimenticolaceae bacterium]
MRRLTLLFAVLVAVALAVVMGLGLERLADFAWQRLALLVTLEVALLAATVIFRPEKRLPILCDPAVLFVGFESQFFVVGPLALPYTTFNVESPVPPNMVVMTVLAFIGLLTMYLIGLHIPLGPAIADHLTDFRGAHRHAPGRWMERFLIAVGIAGCAGYAISQGGVSSMLNVGYGVAEGGAYYSAAFLLLVLGTFLMVWRIVNSERWTWMQLSPLAALLAFEVAYWGILMGVRKWLFHLFFGIAAIFLLRRGTRAVPRFLFPTVMIALAVYMSVWGNLRGRSVNSFFQEHADPLQAKVETSIAQGYIEAVAGPFGAACLTLQVFPEIEPFRYGKTLLVALLSPIPRAVWPDKPIGLGKELVWYLGPYYSMTYDPARGLSITPTIVGDFYANLGVFGILLGGLILGVVSRVIARYAVKNMQDGVQMEAARVLVPAVFLAGLVELRADSMMLTLFYMYTMIPLLFLLTVFTFDTTRGNAAEPVDG